MKYITPTMTVISMSTEHIVASSNYHKCDSNCDIWHICRDRHPHEYCGDKKENTSIW